MTTESELIRRYEGVFSKEKCRKIMRHLDYLENNNLLFYDKRNLHMEDHLTLNATLDYEIDLTATTRVAEEILPMLKKPVDDYLEAVSILKSSRFLCYDCKIKKIPQGGGFHNWHFENGVIGATPRTFVIQVYLNDDFEGGETEFLYQNRREQAVQGDVLIFPAGFTHTHRGNPPIGGTKYLATTWAIIQPSDDN